MSKKGIKCDRGDQKHEEAFISLGYFSAYEKEEIG